MRFVFRHSLVGALFAICTVLSLDVVLAETRFALVIGNGDYRAAGDLPNAKNDARLMETAFKAVGFETQLLLDLNEDSMGDALDDLASRAASLDVVAIYYAGHGIQKDNTNFLIPVDAQIETETAIERETISLQSFLDVVAGVPISMLFLDACRNNPFAEKLAENAKTQGRSARVTRGLAVVRPVGDMLITFATLPNTVATDGAGENSPFATSLAKHILTPNAEVSVLMKRVTRDVVNETKGAQRPQQLSQMQEEFYFARADSGQVTRDEFRSVLSIYPATVGTGDEVAVVADVPPSCRPSFFDLSEGGKAIPVPLRFFRQVRLSGSMVRYEISPGSRFGLVVQEQDERGRHTFGFFCQPEGMAKDNKKELLEILSRKLLQGGTEGQIEVDGAVIDYHFANYSIE